MAFTSDGSAGSIVLFRRVVLDWRVKPGDETSGQILLEIPQGPKFTGTLGGNEGILLQQPTSPRSGVSQRPRPKSHFHKPGTAQKSDQLIFGGSATPRRYAGAGLTEDERFLIITASQSTTGNELYVQDLKGSQGKSYR